MQNYYDRAIADINKTIDAEYDKFQDPEAARKTVSQMDVQAYQNTAKQIVAKAEQMRKDGKTVTYGDFSDEVNARLKVYNATMRINRLENIKSQIGAEMLSANLDVQSAISDKLTDDYQAEIKRQAGIMGETTEGKLWTSKQVAKVVMTQTHGADFSKRIWANQDALKAELDGIVSTGIIRGESPRRMATRIKSQVKDSVMNHKYVTERIARTESARVQYTAQIDEIKRMVINMFNGLQNQRHVLNVQVLLMLIMAMVKAFIRLTKCLRYLMILILIVDAQLVRRGLTANRI